MKKIPRSLVKEGLEIAKYYTFMGIPIDQRAPEDAVACLAISARSIIRLMENAKKKVLAECVARRTGG